MKTKKLNKKLTLKKESIANLGFSEMKGIHAGGDIFDDGGVGGTGYPSCVHISTYLEPCLCP